MSFSERISPLLGRVILAWFFLSAAWSLAASWDGQVAMLDFAHYPAPPVLLSLAILVMTLGGLSLLLGFHTRHGAMLLFGFTVIATVLMHAYWNVKNPTDRAADYEIFARNVAIAGALLFLVGMGGGSFALDNAGQKKKPR
jgi:putative oxidoreductase